MILTLFKYFICRFKIKKFTKISLIFQITFYMKLPLLEYKNQQISNMSYFLRYNQIYIQSTFIIFLQKQQLLML